MALAVPSTVSLCRWPGVRPVASSVPCQIGPPTWVIGCHCPSLTEKRTRVAGVLSKTSARTGLFVAPGETL